jgi:hypothetical protein
MHRRHLKGARHFNSTIPQNRVQPGETKTGPQRSQHPREYPHKHIGTKSQTNRDVHKVHPTPPLGWTTPPRGEKVQHRLPKIKPHKKNQGDTPPQHTSGVHYKRPTLETKNTALTSGHDNESPVQHTTHEISMVKNHTRPTKSVNTIIIDGATDFHKKNGTTGLSNQRGTAFIEDKTSRTRYRGKDLN